MKGIEINVTAYNLIPAHIECPPWVEKCVAQSYARLVVATVTEGHFTNVVRIEIGFIQL